MTEKSGISGPKLLAMLIALLACLLTTPAVAQGTPEEYTARDDRGVDLVTGSYNTDILEGRIGPDEGGVSLVRYYSRAGFGDNWSGDLRRTNVGGVNTITIRFGGVSQRFTNSGDGWVPANGNGATLMEVTTDREWTYRTASGTVITYKAPELISEQSDGSFFGAQVAVEMPPDYCSSLNALGCGVATRIAQPNGVITTLTWDTPRICLIYDPIPDNGPLQDCKLTYRLSDVRTNRGYAMKLAYAADIECPSSEHLAQLAA